ncbi:hypothetical protein HYN59_15560 [Flavobacterium album]|uniref:Uncharacterized protein n=1 Tax=Flavobacterium album TaxID=2175091 RepID=A0A2S1R1B7_9FLAO|nr:hypothetical protein HYN59_15560 [Flavobacterium album]
MKKYIPLLAVALLVCLFIYVFYRTEKTLVNQVVIALISRGRYHSLKTAIISALPLRDCIVYSLPEGLWVFCITLTSGPFYIRLKNYKLRLVFIPILIAVGMELLQLVHFLNGRFDLMDIAFSTGFWLLALLRTRNHLSEEPIFRSFDTQSVSCIVCYSIVYLAHVIY